MQSDYFKNDFVPKNSDWTQVQKKIEEGQKRNQDSVVLWGNLILTMVFFALGSKAFQFFNNQTFFTEDSSIKVSGNATFEKPTLNPRVRYFAETSRELKKDY